MPSVGFVRALLVAALVGLPVAAVGSLVVAPAALGQEASSSLPAASQPATAAPAASVAPPSSDAAAASSDAAAPSSDAAPVPLTPEEIVADRVFWKKGDCTSCHGWSGNGHDTGPIPPGPSLRDTQLELSTIRETIQCGRPGTSMPSHDRLAYTDTRCYGMKSVEMGTSKPQKGTPLRAEEIDAVTDYVVRYLKGKGPVTKAECEEYWSAGNPVCSEYQ